MNGLELLLKHSNMQNKELADKLNVSKQIISIWVKGTRPIPKKYLPQLCEILNTSETFLTRNINEQFLNNMILSILNKDYKYLLATMFEVHKELVDDSLIDIIKKTIEKKELEDKCAKLGYKMSKVEN
jgi:transcriptional regulator with XRE-family HTH domain